MAFGPQSRAVEAGDKYGCWGFWPQHLRRLFKRTESDGSGYLLMLGFMVPASALQRLFEKELRSKCHWKRSIVDAGIYGPSIDHQPTAS